MDIIYISWDKAIRMCYELSEKILESNEDFEVIVAISRGGLIPARIVSDVLGVYDLYVINSRFWGIGGMIFPEPVVKVPRTLEVKDKKVLVVDEVVDTGKTMSKALNVLKGLGAKELKTATLHYKVRSKLVPDYYVEKVEKWVWIFYPWSFSETIYSLAKSRSPNNVVNIASEIIRQLGIKEVPLTPKCLKNSLITYLRRGL